ncbi:MAG: ABC transporter ATP-binding protein [Bacteroidales bacterium]|nr:ABC transporter ATP-binding protein [Candidatus Cacconaster merdequi]
MEGKTRITARNLCIGYRNNIVHPSLDFSLQEGEVVCLMGANGAGKSTLIKTVCGMIPSLSGSLQKDGEIGVVLTEKDNAGGLTVYDMVSIGRYRHTDFFGTLKEEDKAIVRDSLEAVGLMTKAHRFMSEISDGERQKAFIAKALAQECPILVLDEPTAFLDVKSRIEVMKLLQNLAHQKNKAVLISTHDLDNAINYSDTIWLLSPEEKLIAGTPANLVKTGTINIFFNIDNVK